MNSLSQPIAPSVNRPALMAALIASGATPVLVCAAAAVLAPPDLAAAAASACLKYSAVVIGFLGGIRWGAELMRNPSAPNPGRLVAAASTTVLAWAGLILERQTQLAFALLLAGAGVLLVWDLRAAAIGLLPAWTARLRIMATITAAAGIAAVIAFGPGADGFY
jgi:hypothetical protein